MFHLNQEINDIVNLPIACDGTTADFRKDRTVMLEFVYNTDGAVNLELSAKLHFSLLFF